MSEREQYKIMIENDVNFVIDKIIEKNNELTSQDVKIEELETQLQQKENIIKEVREYAGDLRLFDNESLEFKISNELFEILDKVEEIK